MEQQTLEARHRPVIITHIAVELPMPRIYTRLGFHKATTRVTEAEAARIRRILDEGRLAAQPAGVYVRTRIAQCDAQRIVLDDGRIWPSAHLAAFLGDAQEIFILGATMGTELLMRREQALEQGDTLKAVLFDALASELVESAVQWLHEAVGKIVRKELKTVTKRRYSPGYGDFALCHQPEIVSLLQFEKLGVRVNDHNLLIPEKSVTALVGILS